MGTNNYATVYATCSLSQVCTLDVHTCTCTLYNGYRPISYMYFTPFPFTQLRVSVPDPVPPAKLCIRIVPPNLSHLSTSLLIFSSTIFTVGRLSSSLPDNGSEDRLTLSLALPW